MASVCNPAHSAVATGIKQASENYVEDYWNRRKGKNVDENEALETLLRFIEKERQHITASIDDEEAKAAVRVILDAVAKQNMSTYYNMLLPQAVC